MKNLSLSLFGLFFLPGLTLAQNVVVKSFISRDGIETEIVNSNFNSRLTHEFEEALAQFDKFKILEQRDNARLKAAIKDIEGARNSSDISQANLNDLKELQVEMIVFGEVFDDYESGEINIKVTFEELNGRKAIIKSISMKRGLSRDYTSRKNTMTALVGDIMGDDLFKQMYNQLPMQIAKQLEQLKSNEIDYNENMKPSTKKDINLNVELFDLRIGPQFSIDLREGLEDYDIFISNDGEDYIKYTYHKIKRETFLGKEDRLFIKLISRIDGKVIGPIEEKGVFSAVAKIVLEGQTKEGFQRYVKCTPTGCEIDRYELCNSFASKITLSRTKGKTEKFYDLKVCEGDELPYVEACLSPPNEIFPLRLKQVIFCNIEYEDGYKIPFEVTVSEKLNSGTEEQWVELEPEKEKGKTVNNAPYAAAKLGSMYGAFEVFLGAGSCHSYDKKVKAFLYDIDGKGLTELASYDITSNPFPIPNPLQPKISIAYELESGQRVGPFTYKFDIQAIIQAAAKNAKPPRLEHSYNESGFYCQAPGTYGSILSWVNVKGIKYGPSQDKLTQTKSIKVTDEDMISYGSGTQIESDKVLHFDIPKDWTDVWYKIEFMDGKATEAIRLPLKRY